MTLHVRWKGALRIPLVAQNSSVLLLPKVAAFWNTMIQPPDDASVDSLQKICKSTWLQKWLQKWICKHGGIFWNPQGLMCKNIKSHIGTLSLVD